MSLLANLETDGVAGFSCVCLGMLAWLKSSSQDPMVAARLASLPLLPSGPPEDAAGTAAGGTSACLFNMGSGVPSGTSSEVPKKKVEVRII